MKELTAYEVDQVGGASLIGFAVGGMEGAVTGLLLANKLANVGGWGFRALAQFVGGIVGPIMGAAAGGVIGFFTSPKTVTDIFDDYRNSFGVGLKDS